MGYLGDAKEAVYLALGELLNKIPVGTPINETLMEILYRLYTESEAMVGSKFPFVPMKLMPLPELLLCQARFFFCDPSAKLGSAKYSRGQLKLSSVSHLGLRLHEDLSSLDIEGRYFRGRTDYYRATEHAHIACAVVNKVT